MQTRNKIVGWLLGAGIALSSGVVIHNEGYSGKAYKDGAGVWTICYGETKGVNAGMVKSKAECDKQLLESLETHAAALNGFPDTTPKVVALGSLDMAYNVGIGGFNGSSVKRYILQKDYTKAGQAVLQWKYIHRYQKSNPGKGWVLVTQGKWRFDCSVKGNKVCSGLWDRRVWQSKAIGNQFKTPEEALAALRKI